MKQLEDKHICRYCMGCVAEELDTFIPKMNCPNFVPAYSDWQERYYKALKEEKKWNNG